jgi:hypothetical protein
MAERSNKQTYIGALWRKGKDKNGNNFLSGVIDIPIEIVKANIVKKEGKHYLKLNHLVFKNTKKEEGSKQPDYNLVVFSDEEESKDDDVPW